MLSGQVIHTLCTAKGLKSKDLEKLPSGTRTFLLSEYLKYLTCTLMRVHLNASGFFDDDVINSDDDVMTARSKAIKAQVRVINMSHHLPYRYDVMTASSKA